MACIVDKLIEEEITYHKLLVDTYNCFEETVETFPELPVFKLKEGTEYKLERKMFSNFHYVHEKTDKTGICLTDRNCYHSSCRRAQFTRQDTAAIGRSSRREPWSQRHFSA